MTIREIANIYKVWFYDAQGFKEFVYVLAYSSEQANDKVYDRLGISDLISTQICVDGSSLLLQNQGVKYTQYNNNWKKENTVRIVLQLNNVKDADLIRLLKGESNKSAFIKDCIRKVVSETTKD